MAKSKPVPKIAAKKLVPTSAMFTYVNRDKARKAKSPKLCFKVKKKGDNDYYNSAVRKAKTIADHPLAVAFTSTIEKSRNQIGEQTDSAIDFTHQNLTERLTSSGDSFNKTLQVMKTCKEEVIKPLALEKLHFKSNDGKFTSTQTLGDRMRQFQNLVAAEEKQLEALWKRWTEVHQSITNLVLEMLGSTRLERTLKKSTGKLSEFVGPRRKAVAEEVEKERKKWEGEIANMGKTSVANMLASEEEMKLLQKRQRNDLLKLLDTDTY